MKQEELLHQKMTQTRLKRDSLAFLTSIIYASTLNSRKFILGISCSDVHRLDAIVFAQNQQNKREISAAFFASDVK